MRIAIAWLAHERQVVRRMRHIANCSKTRVYELLAAREFEPYPNGRSRRITAHSLRRYLARRLATCAEKRRRLPDEDDDDPVDAA